MIETSRAGLPARTCRRAWISMRGWICSCPQLMARTTVASSTISAPASSITTPSRVPVTTRSRAGTEPSGSMRGLATNWSPSSPTRIAPTGPSNGRPDRPSAADAATMPMTSGSFSPSWVSNVSTIWVSLRIPSGKSGLRERSAKRPARMPDSGGRPSRRRTLPGIRPIEYVRSSNSTCSGKKSRPARGPAATTVASRVVSP